MAWTFFNFLAHCAVRQNKNGIFLHRVKNFYISGLTEYLFPYFFQISGQWDSNQKLWEARIKEMSQNFQQKTDTVNYTVFESMQTIMDYFEESLENLMLPASEGK